MHCIDEGPRDGRPVVLVHGNPTWGFVYRNFVGPLINARYRVIVPTTSASAAPRSRAPRASAPSASTPSLSMRC